jgi:hypothetical protein
MITSFDRGRRNAMIEILVDNDINTIESDMNTVQSGDGSSYLYDLLTLGFKGYENMFDDELVQEMNERDLWDNFFKDQK